MMQQMYSSTGSYTHWVTPRDPFGKRRTLCGFPVDGSWYPAAASRSMLEVCRRCRASRDR